MKTLLLTAADEAMKVADLTVPIMQQYAGKLGWDFRCYLGPMINVPNGIYWTCVCGALHGFRDGFERVLYLDADQLITNQDYLIPEWRSGFHVSRDWGEDAVEPNHFSMCGYIAFPDVEFVFMRALSLEQEYRDIPFPAQAPMQHACLEVMASGRDLIHVHPRKVFNNVPEQICPGKVPEPWQPGDWCAHLTMLEQEKRLELGHQILSGL